MQNWSRVIFAENQKKKVFLNEAAGSVRLSRGATGARMAENEDEIRKLRAALKVFFVFEVPVNK